MVSICPYGIFTLFTARRALQVAWKSLESVPTQASFEVLRGIVSTVLASLQMQDQHLLLSVVQHLPNPTHHPATFAHHCLQKPQGSG